MLAIVEANSPIHADVPANATDLEMARAWGFVRGYQNSLDVLKALGEQLDVPIEEEPTFEDPYKDQFTREKLD
jgi:hypothetical protein